MATHYIPNESGWSSQKVNWGSSAAGNGRLRLVATRTYNQSTNKSTLSFKAYVYSTVLDGPFQVTQGSTIKVNGSTLFSFPQATIFSATVNKSSNWSQIVRTAGAAAENHWDVTLDHDASGNLSATVEVNITMTYTLGGTTYVMHWANSGTLTASEPRASSIASVTNPVNTQDTLTVTVNRASSAFYHKATLKKGSTELWTSGAFATTVSITVPRTWFSAFPNDASLACTLTVKTYPNSSCTAGTELGSTTASVTVKADSGMKPVLQSGYASAAPYNTGTAAAGISGYVSGVSKAKVTLDSSKLTMAEGANVAGIKVAGGGVEDTTQPYITGVLAGTATITVTVTDSRGRSGTQTLTVQTMPYAAPTISQVHVFRCDSQGAEDEDGTYISVKATGGVSSLNGQNSLTLTAAWAEGSGAYGAEQTLASGTASKLGGGTLDPDKKLSMRITATDALGNSTQTTVLLPPRVWAMKFRPNGQGVGFGMAPSQDKVLELPAGWKIIIGGTVVAQG